MGRQAKLKRRRRREGRSSRRARGERHDHSECGPGCPDRRLSLVFAGQVVVEDVRGEYSLSEVAARIQRPEEELALVIEELLASEGR